MYPVLGHEWDEDIDNGFRPHGLIRLSETTLDNVQYIVDHGSVYDTGSATHSLTMYKSTSGALVFGAGTVQWSWGLDECHDDETGVPAIIQNIYDIRVGCDPLAPDHNIQQATINLFADMGVQPAHLEIGLQLAQPSMDTIPPVSTVLQCRCSVSNSTALVSVQAQDADGCVAGVEVSTNYSEGWHPATFVGGESCRASDWIYEWAWTSSSRSFKFYFRAVDDSLNIEHPKEHLCSRSSSPSSVLKDEL